MTFSENSFTLGKGSSVHVRHFSRVQRWCCASARLLLSSSDSLSEARTGPNIKASLLELLCTPGVGGSERQPCLSAPRSEERASDHLWHVKAPGGGRPTCLPAHLSACSLPDAVRHTRAAVSRSRCSSSRRPKQDGVLRLALRTAAGVGGFGLCVCVMSDSCVMLLRV